MIGKCPTEQNLTVGDPIQRIHEGESSEGSHVHIYSFFLRKIKISRDSGGVRSSALDMF